MNIFVLCTGHCGSTTFIRSCQYITNYTSAHESQSGYLGEAHFKYPNDHIEADNALAWFTGRLEKAYGNGAMYVHLKRKPRDVARTLTTRYNEGIIRSYRNHILRGWAENEDPMKVSLDMCETLNTNIEYFLRDKDHVMEFWLENAQEDFKKFWSFIGAEGDQDAALAEWNVAYNATPEDRLPAAKTPHARRVGSKMVRIARKLPAFIRSA